MDIKSNPLVKKSPHRYGAIPFDQIKQEHFLPAFKYAIEDAEQKLKEIINASTRKDGTLDLKKMLKNITKHQQGGRRKKTRRRK